MTERTRRRAASLRRALGLALGVCGFVAPGPLGASGSDRDVPEIADEEFRRLHALVKPRVGESRWMEIDWFPDLWDARRRAAEEGKPIFLMAGSGGAPAAGC